MKLLVRIGGMHCQSCVEAVRASLAQLPAATDCTVTVGAAELTIDESRTGKADVFTAIRNAGAFEVDSFRVA